MPRKKLDRSVAIADQKKKQIAFCRQKKELIKKAVELSMMCEQDVLLVVYDKETDKMTYFSSTEDFSLAAAHQAKHKGKEPLNIHKFERFTNQNYDDLCKKDFREVRYKREKVYNEAQEENEAKYFASKRLKKAEAKTESTTTPAPTEEAPSAQCLTQVADKGVEVLSSVADQPKGEEKILDAAEADLFKSEALTNKNNQQALEPIPLLAPGSNEHSLPIPPHPEISFSNEWLDDDLFPQGQNNAFSDLALPFHNSVTVGEDEHKFGELWTSLQNGSDECMMPPPSAVMLWEPEEQL